MVMIACTNMYCYSFPFVQLLFSPIWIHSLLLPIIHLPCPLLPLYNILYTPPTHTTLLPPFELVQVSSHPLSWCIYLLLLSLDFYDRVCLLLCLVFSRFSGESGVTTPRCFFAFYHISSRGIRWCKFYVSWVFVVLQLFMLSDICLTLFSWCFLDDVLVLVLEGRGNSSSRIYDRSRFIIINWLGCTWTTARDDTAVDA